MEDEEEDGVALLLPGLGSSHARHLVSSDLLLTIQTAHSQLPTGLANFKDHELSKEDVVLVGIVAPGLTVSHAGHLTASLSLTCNIHTEQDQDPGGGLQ